MALLPFQQVAHHNLRRLCSGFEWQKKGATDATVTAHPAQQTIDRTAEAGRWGGPLGLGGRKA